MAVRTATPEQIEAVLKALPQQDPFRFVSGITELDEEQIVGYVDFTGEEFFYKGHFPGSPVTPGVIMLETMAQFSVVALNLFHRILAGDDMSRLAYFVEADVEFSSPVVPPARLTARGRKVFWRRGKLRSECRLELPDGRIAASGVIAGMEGPPPGDAR